MDYIWDYARNHPFQTAQAVYRGWQILDRFYKERDPYNAVVQLSRVRPSPTPTPSASALPSPSRMPFTRRGVRVPHWTRAGIRAKARTYTRRRRFRSKLKRRRIKQYRKMMGRRHRYSRFRIFMTQNQRNAEPPIRRVRGAGTCMWNASNRGRPYMSLQDTIAWRSTMNSFQVNANPTKTFSDVDYLLLSTPTQNVTSVPLGTTNGGGVPIFMSTLAKNSGFENFGISSTDPAGVAKVFMRGIRVKGNVQCAHNVRRGYFLRLRLMCPKNSSSVAHIATGPYFSYPVSDHRDWKTIKTRIFKFPGHIAGQSYASTGGAQNAYVGKIDWYIPCNRWFKTNDGTIADDQTSTEQSKWISGDSEGHLYLVVDHISESACAVISDASNAWNGNFYVRKYWGISPFAQAAT